MALYLQFLYLEVNYEIVELEEFAGSMATIYSAILDGDNLTLFDHFVDENKIDHRQEVKSIVNRLLQISKSTGAREKFFKTFEGLPGDGVCALYDEPDSKLRLYCIRYGNVAIILGGGGLKGPGVRTWQEDEKLRKEAELVIKISKDIMAKLNEGELEWSNDGLQLLGNLTFRNNEEE